MEIHSDLTNQSSSLHTDNISTKNTLLQKMIVAFVNGNEKELSNLTNSWLQVLSSNLYQSSKNIIDKFESYIYPLTGKYFYTHSYSLSWIPGTLVNCLPSAIFENLNQNENGSALETPIPLQLVIDLGILELQKVFCQESFRTPLALHPFWILPLSVVQILSENKFLTHHDRQAALFFEKLIHTTDFSKLKKLQIEGNSKPENLVKGISIIVPVFNKCELTSQFIESLNVNPPENVPYELIIVDNASTDQTATILEQYKFKFSWLKVISRPSNGGYGSACNAGAKTAQYSHLIIMNNDMLLFPHWTIPLIESFGDPIVGIVGARLIYPDFSTQHAGIVFNEQLLPVHNSRRIPFTLNEVSYLKQVGAVTGACMMISRDLFEKVKGFDECYRMYYEDVDLCLRVQRAGYKILYNPECTLIHLEAKSSDSFAAALESNKASMPIFLNRWGNFLRAALQKDGDLFRYGIPIYETEEMNNTLNISIEALSAFQESFGRMINGDLLAAYHIALVNWDQIGKNFGAASADFLISQLTESYRKIISRSSYPPPMGIIPKLQMQPTNQLESFVNELVKAVTQGNLKEALNYYNAHRGSLPTDNDDIKQVDELIGKIRLKLGMVK